MDRIKKKIGKKTVPEISKETLILQTYIEGLDNGAELSWEKIENDTGILMDNNNKAHLRTACKRARREYSCIYGYGIRLADTESVMPILTNRLVKIDKTVKRGEKSQKILQEQFFHTLSEKEQKDILFVGACFGAIRIAAENGKLIFKHEQPKQIKSGINIPFKQ